VLLRTCFARWQPLRYISHLEIMTLFRRAFRRAELPVTYSQGYNPHINLSMGQPLSVGMTGESEYYDLELQKEINLDSYVKKLNNFLPSGIEILAAREVPSGVKSLQAVVNTAVYLFDMEFKSSVREEDVIEKFLNLTEIKIIRHRRNKKDRELDLKPMIYDAEIKETGLWKFTVSTGSSGNVRWGEIIRSLAERFEDIKKIPVINVHREGMYVKINKRLFAPFDDEVVGR